MPSPALAFITALSSGLSSSAVPFAPVIPPQTYLDAPPAEVAAVGDPLASTLSATPWRATASTESASVTFDPTGESGVYQLYVDTSCNEISGEVRILNSRIELVDEGGLLTTLMGCTPQLHVLENELRDIFSSSPEVRWDPAAAPNTDTVWVVDGERALELTRRS